MNKREIRKILRNLDEKTAIRLGERHCGLTDADQARLLRRIEQNLAEPQDSHVSAPMPEHPPCAPPISRFESLHGIAAAAACFLVCGGTVAGLFWLKAHQPMTPEQEPAPAVTEAQAPASEAVSLPAARTYAVGEPFAAWNLTSSGTLRVTADAAEMTDSGYAVTLTLTSERAKAWDGGNMFLLDNFLLETDAALLSPVGIARLTEDGGYPYAVTLADGDTVSVTLYYSTEDSRVKSLQTGSGSGRSVVRLS